MNRAGGLPANLELRKVDEGRLVARNIPFPLAHKRGHYGSLDNGVLRKKGVDPKVKSESL